jgi:hypothetical protein
MSIIEWHRSRLRLRFITSNQPIFSWEIVFLFFSFLMMDQTNDIFSHRVLFFCSVKHNQTYSKYIYEGAFSHNIRSSEHTLQCTFFFVSIVVKIANDYFSWANGHISETIIHIDHHPSLQWKREKETRRCQNDLFLAHFLLRRTCVCNFLSHIYEWEKPDTYQHPFV